MKIRRASKEALMEVFGTPNPSLRTIVRWKSTWRESAGKIQVKSYSAALKTVRANNIDPLYYQLFADHDTTKFYIAFYDPEHEVFFKLHNDLG